MARAWLTIAMRVNGVAVAEPSGELYAGHVDYGAGSFGRGRTGITVSCRCRHDGHRAEISWPGREWPRWAGTPRGMGAGSGRFRCSRQREGRRSRSSRRIRIRAHLAERMLEGMRACGLNVRGKSVLLKPNLVEFDPDTCINTNVAVIAAAYEAFHTLGAAEVRIGEGPGHRRDTYALAEMARYRGGSRKFDSLFVDLNRDDVSPVQRFADRERDLSAEHGAAGGSDGFAGQDEDASLGGRDAVDEEFLRAGSGIGVRLAEE